MMDDGQLQLDMTLQSERDIKENVQTAVRFTMNKIMTGEAPPSPVRNRHEAYGIVAENYAKASAALKRVSGDMSTLLNTLGDIDRPALDAVSSICNDSLDAAIAAIIMAAEMQRTLSDLYIAENQEPHYPMDDLTTAEGDGFEEAPPVETDNTNENEMEEQ